MFIHSSMYQNGISYLVDHLKENKYLIDHHFYSDHLSYRDRMSLIKRIFDKSNVILLSGEAQEHSWRYRRPKWIAEAYFTHISAKNSIYYTLFFEESLAHEVFLSDIADFDVKNKVGILLAASNNAKIIKFKKNYANVFDEIDLYGAFSKKVPENKHFSSSEDPLNTRNYFYDARLLSKQYKAAICLDNSYENGYFQGTPMLHLNMGTVPIYDGPPYWKNFINEKYVIELSKYNSFTDIKKAEEIEKVSRKIVNANGDFLTELSKDYLNFLRNSLTAEKIDFNNMIRVSDDYRGKFLNV